jgi:NAD(P)-dependent dehydrogenase (short-subunit alcohol dehydrogenase family)
MIVSSDQRTAVVTGSSSGIGFETYKWFLYICKYA